MKHIQKKKRLHIQKKKCIFGGRTRRDDSTFRKTTNKSREPNPLSQLRDLARQIQHKMKIPCKLIDDKKTRYDKSSEAEWLNCIGETSSQTTTQGDKTRPLRKLFNCKSRVGTSNGRPQIKLYELNANRRRTKYPLPGALDDRFLSNAFKRCFKLSGVLLKLCELILGCDKKIICSVILGELEYS